MNYMGPVVYAPPQSAAALRRASAGGGGVATHRKRSKTSASPGDDESADASRLSFAAARKTESDKDLAGAQRLAPLGVVFMEQVSLEMDVLREPHTEVKYVLRVRHLKSQATWSHVRSFDDYRRFQHRLLKALDHGHFCSAECPWLYTFLKSYFPKKHLFHFATTARVVASRQDALQRFFTSLQGFLLNKDNHACTLIATAVVDAVVEFVYGDYAKYYQVEDADNAGSNQRVGGGSFCQRAPPALPDEDEASTASASSSSCGTVPAACICVLCESSLEGEAYAATRSGLSATVLTSSVLTSTASSTSLTSDDSPMDASDLVVGGSSSAALCASAPASFSAISATTFSSSFTGRRRGTHYVMTLGCGHQFHDECIVPKLNETLRCPICDHLEVK